MYRYNPPLSLSPFISFFVSPFVAKIPSATANNLSSSLLKNLLTLYFKHLSAAQKEEELKRGFFPFCCPVFYFTKSAGGPKEVQFMLFFLSPVGMRNEAAWSLTQDFYFLWREKIYLILALWKFLFYLKEWCRTIQNFLKTNEPAVNALTPSLRLFTQPLAGVPFSGYNFLPPIWFASSIPPCFKPAFRSLLMHVSISSMCKLFGFKGWLYRAIRSIWQLHFPWNGNLASFSESQRRRWYNWQTKKN